MASLLLLKKNYLSMKGPQCSSLLHPHHSLPPDTWPQSLRYVTYKYLSLQPLALKLLEKVKVVGKSMLGENKQTKNSSLNKELEEIEKAWGLGELPP